MIKNLRLDKYVKYKMNKCVHLNSLTIYYSKVVGREWRLCVIFYFRIGYVNYYKMATTSVPYETTGLGTKMEYKTIPCYCHWPILDIIFCSCQDGILSLLQVYTSLLLLLKIKIRLNPSSLALRMAFTKASYTASKQDFLPLLAPPLKIVIPSRFLAS